MTKRTDDSKKPLFREDGLYPIDFSELEKIKKQNIDNGKLRYKLTEDQFKFLTDYWFFLTVTQRAMYLEKLFPGKSYQGIVKRIEYMRNSGIVFKKPGPK
jgi:hypothetical protein